MGTLGQVGIWGEPSTLGGAQHPNGGHWGKWGPWGEPSRRDLGALGGKQGHRGDQHLRVHGEGTLGWCSACGGSRDPKGGGGTPKGEQEPQGGVGTPGRVGQVAPWGAQGQVGFPGDKGACGDSLRDNRGQQGCGAVPPTPKTPPSLTVRGGGLWEGDRCVPNLLCPHLGWPGAAGGAGGCGARAAFWGGGGHSVGTAGARRWEIQGKTSPGVFFLGGGWRWLLVGTPLGTAWERRWRWRRGLLAAQTGSAGGGPWPRGGGVMQAAVSVLFAPRGLRCLGDTRDFGGVPVMGSPLAPG